MFVISLTLAAAGVTGLHRCACSDIVRAERFSCWRFSPRLAPVSTGDHRQWPGMASSGPARSAKICCTVAEIGSSAWRTTAKMIPSVRSTARDATQRRPRPVSLESPGRERPDSDPTRYVFGLRGPSRRSLRRAGPRELPHGTSRQGTQSGMGNEMPSAHDVCACPQAVRSNKHGSDDLAAGNVPSGTGDVGPADGLRCRM